MGGESTSSRAIVRSAGFAYRLSAKRLKDEFNQHGQLQTLLLRYTQAMLTQMGQTAVCNRHHSVAQQLCRWLIANMLGVRREGVTAAAGKLQRLGIIHYRRGQVTVLDRPKLERACCECYSVVKKESDRLARMNLPERKRAAGPISDGGAAEDSA